MKKVYLIFAFLSLLSLPWAQEESDSAGIKNFVQADTPEEALMRRRKPVDKPRQSAEPSQKPLSQSRGVNLQKSSTTEKLKLEVVEEPITNIFRMISKAYNLNIVPESDVGDIRVTLHLEDISVKEGLEVLVQANGLEMYEKNNVIYIKKASDKAIAEMNMYSTKIDITVENQPVKDFLKDFAQKTGISIVPDQNLEGKVTGHIKNVLPINGLKAVMAANNYRVRQKSGIYLVENMDSESSGTPESGPRRGRKSFPTPTGGSSLDVDVVDNKVTVSLNNANLADVIRNITQQSGVDIIVYGTLDGIVNAEFKEIPVDKALSLLLQGTQYTYIVRDGMILIGQNTPNSPSGSALSTVEVFPLKYMRADQALTLVPKTLPAEGIKVMKEQNAFMISGTADQINQLKEFMAKIDQPVPQVLVEVVIVEYDRSSSSELGVESGTGNFGVNEIGASMNIDKVTRSLKNLGPFKGSVGILPQNWQLKLRSLLSKSRGKVLAMPQITTLNGNAAQLKVSRTQYYPVRSETPEGRVLLDYRAIDDGITIDLTPWVTQYGDVNLEIKPSVKTSLPSNAPDQPAPVTDRAVSTNVRLLNGETLILGGLIDSKENYIRSFVPILGHIPLLGYLFSWRKKSTSTNELVLFVTPHILTDSTRNVDLLQELKGLDKRSGFLEETDFLGRNKNGDSGTKKKGKSIAPPDSAAGKK